MIPGPEAQRARAFLRNWWIVWGASLVSLGLLSLVFGRGRLLPPAPAANPLPNLVGLVPLFVSIIIRWLVLPRYNDLKAAFPLFVFGVALAGGCGVLGLFLGGPYRDSLQVLGLLGLIQFIPFFARVYLEPRPQGFIPNN
jgi:hypothetical protein